MSWVVITVIASLSQTLRSVFQKNIIEDVGVLASAYSRFVFALPFVALLALFFLGTQEIVLLKTISLKAWFFLIAASICQILFTIILIKLFTLRSFAIGIAFSKTEVIQTTLLEITIIGFILTSHVFLSIIIGFIGVLFMSKQKLIGKLGYNSLFLKQVTLGVLCGIFLGLSSVLYKVALDSVITDFIYKKVLVLSFLALAFQSVIFGTYIVSTEGKQNVLNLFSIWKKGLPVGFFGCAATFCWFSAFSLVDATFVRAVGQLEIVFSVLISYIFYKEKITGFELIGMSLITISILALLGIPNIY
ncbi:MAG: EamA family transporter [Paracoccaceae bacterium]